MSANAIPVKDPTKALAGTPNVTKYHFIGIGKNCPVVTPTKITKDYWRDSYNRVLQGLGIYVERIDIVPRLPRERKLTVVSRLGETETRATMVRVFIKEQIFEKMFKEKEYPEVVVKDYVVQGGYVTSTQVYGVIE